jgi:hypothetical protein
MWPVATETIGIFEKFCIGREVKNGVTIAAPALGNPAKAKTPDPHIPTAPAATGNISKLQDDLAKVTFSNCLTGFLLVLDKIS